MMKSIGGRAAILGGVLLAWAVAACSSESPGRLDDHTTDLASVMRAYIGEPAVGRRALEESLVRHDNTYAVLRLSRYAEDRWGSLPQADFPSIPMAAGPDGAPLPPPALDDPRWKTTLGDSGDTSDTGIEELRALGERAFFAYPVQPSDTMAAAVATPDHAGVWQHEGRLAPVWVSLPRGLVRAAFTCATCHASKIGDRLIPGRNDPDLDVARLYDNGASAVSGAGTPSWGRGRVDVTPDGMDNPVAISDLRPIRYQQHIHHAGTLKNDPVALAVRIETLIITSQSQAVRPPRKIAAALAVYLLGLAPTSPLPKGEGAAVFGRECGSCHAGEAASGPPVSLALIGTDPKVGASTERGTGFYRVPSLRAVGDRRRLLASGEVDDIAALLSPDRAAAGHRYGMALGAQDREALLVYLRGL